MGIKSMLDELAEGMEPIAVINLGCCLQSGIRQDWEAFLSEHVYQCSPSRLQESCERFDQVREMIDERLWVEFGPSWYRMSDKDYLYTHGAWSVAWGLANASKQYSCIWDVERVVQGKKRVNAVNIGCGIGAVDVYLAASGLCDQITGVDGAASSVAFASELALRAGIKNATFVEASADRTGLRSRSYDLVILDDLIHLTRNPWGALEEAARLLAPHGTLLITYQPSRTLRSGRIDPWGVIDRLSGLGIHSWEWGPEGSSRFQLKASMVAGC